MRQTAAERVSYGTRRFRSMVAGSFLVTDAWFAGKDTLPPHHHDRTVVGVTISGDWDSVVGSRTLSNRSGVLHTEPAGDTHSNHFGPGGTHVFIVQPDPAATDLLEPCRPLLTQVHQLVPEGARSLAGRLVRELSCPDDLSSMAVEAGCLELLASASRLTLQRNAQLPAWLLRVADYVRAEFRRTPKLEEFAAGAGVHPSHVVREFKRAFGETPASRIRRFRLE